MPRPSDQLLPDSVWWGMGTRLKRAPSRAATQKLCTAIIPAAGFSRRMGQAKQLLPVDGKPMLLAVIDSIREPADPWMTAGDFRSFIDAQALADESYRDVPRWTRMSILNAARSGRFSTDRTMQDYNEDIWKLANAVDVMTPNPITITPDDNLNTALMHFTARNLDELPVVSAIDSKTIVGMLRRKETIACYNKRLMLLKKSFDEAEDSITFEPKN